MKEKRGFIKFNLFKKIIDEGSNYGLNSVKFNWRGEPLLHPKIVDMVKYAKSKGVLEVQFNTNGLLLNENLSKNLIKAGLDRIIFSVDGASKETYEKIRRGGKYEKLVNNIETFVKIRGKMKRKLPLTRIQFVRMKENEHETKRFIDKWNRIIDEVNVNPVLSPLGKKVEGEYGRAKSEEIRFLCRKPCNQLWQRLTISYDGKVMMCCGDWSMLNILGNVNKERLYDIWHGKRLNDIRKMHKKLMHKKISACKNCSVLDSYHLKKR